MAIIEKSTPSLQTASGAPSRWVASDNSIDFVYQREDYKVTKALVYLTTQTRFNMTGGGDFSRRVGDQIYIEDVFNRYVGTHTVAGGGMNWFYTNTPFISNTIGFAVDVSRWPNYYLDVEVYNSRTDESLGFVQFVPDQRGEIRVDISTIIANQFRLNTVYKFELVNKREEDWSLAWKIRFSEVFYWDGSIFSASTIKEQGDQFYATKAARQLGDINGQNLRDFEIYPENISTKALFLDEGEISTYFKGYPWSLSFIYGEQTTGIKHEREIEELDVNQTLIAATGQVDYLADVDRGYTNRLSLRKTGFNYGFTGMNIATHFLRLWINETDVVTDDDLGGGGGGSGGGTGSGAGGISGADASLLDDDAVGG